nr:MAG TPA: hypothetical protein [Bacteriophage sp.]
MMSSIALFQKCRLDIIRMLLHNILKEYRICIYILRNLYIHPHDLRHMISGTLS